jgi:hypothetical protein
MRRIVLASLLGSMGECKRRRYVGIIIAGRLAVAVLSTQ